MLLKIGQIWQCRDQTEHVKIIRDDGSAFGGGRSMIGAQFPATHAPPGDDETSGNYYHIAEKYGMHLRAMHPTKDDPTNLVVLLYDPTAD